MPLLQPILFVEDDPAEVALTLRTLRHSQFANPIVVARNGADALDYLYSRGTYAQRRPGPPAAILLDIHLPRLEGIEVLRTVKGDRQLQTIPVVMLTTALSDPNLTLCYEIGANAHTVKPVGPASLLEVMHTIGLLWGAITPALAATPEAT